MGRMLSLLAPDQTLARLSIGISDHRPAMERLTLDSRDRLLPILELLMTLPGTQDIDWREDTQPIRPTTMEQAGPVPKALHVPSQTDHGRTNSRVYVKDRTDTLFKVDHLSQATTTSPVRSHGKVRGSSRMPPCKQFAISARAIVARIRQSLQAVQLNQGECARLISLLGRSNSR